MSQLMLILTALQVVALASSRPYETNVRLLEFRDKKMSKSDLPEWPGRYKPSNWIPQNDDMIATNTADDNEISEQDNYELKYDQESNSIFLVKKLVNPSNYDNEDMFYAPPNKRVFSVLSRWRPLTKALEMGRSPPRGPYRQSFDDSMGSDYGLGAADVVARVKTDMRRPVGNPLRWG